MVATPAHPGEALWIGAAGGKNHYNIGIGEGSTGGNNHEDYSQGLIEDGFTYSIATGQAADKFYLTADRLGAVFRINAGAGRTSNNTAHPRAELREVLANGTTLAAWDGRSGEHSMKARSRMIDFTTNRPWICFAQIHGSPNSPEPSDLVRVQTEGANGTTTNLDIVCRRSPPSGSSEIRTVLRGGYNQNDWVAWELRMDAGRLRIILDGVTALDVTGMGQIANYFKMGCYLQDNVEKGASANDFAAVEVQAGTFVTWHTGYPQPTQPVFTGPDGGAVGDTQPPTVPTDLFGIPGDQKATLTWTASTDNVGVANYKVRRSTGGAAGTTGKTADGASSSASSTDKIAVSRVSPTATGTVTAGHARAWLSAAGTSNTKIVIYADAAGAPGALLAVSDQLAITATTEGQRDYVFSGGNQITVTQGVNYWVGLMWSDPGTPSLNLSRDGDANGRLEVSGFTYPTAPNPFGTGTLFSGPIDVWVETGGVTLVASPTGTSYVDTGLTNGATYGYTVSAIDAAGNESAPSDQVTVTPGPPDVTAPTVPTNLAAVAGDARVSLTWTASTDAVGVLLYRVYRNGVQVSPALLPTGTSYVDTQLTNGVQVSYTVSAVDTSLNESAQSSAVVATPVAPPIGGVPHLPDLFGPRAALAVEIAFGANLAAAESTWAWTDVTTDVRQDPGIDTKLGRNDEASTSNPANLTLVLDNTSGDYSLGGRSQFWPNVRRNTPVRIRFDPGDDAGARVLFLGFADGFTPGWDSRNGKIPVVTLSASGALRRLGQGDAPIQSAFRRALTASPTVVAYWPFEEGKNALQAPAVRGGTEMLLLDLDKRPDWGDSDDFDCSADLPVLNDGSFIGLVTPYPDTGASQVRFLMSIPDNGLTDGTVIMHVHTTGTISRWDITYEIVNGAEQLGLFRWNDDGTRHSDSIIGFGINGIPGRLSLELRQVGGDIVWKLGHKDTLNFTRGAGSIEDTITGKTCGIIKGFEINPHGNIGELAFGHLTVENTTSSLFADRLPLFAFASEPASSGSIGRLERLCAENGVPLVRFTSPATVPNDNIRDTERMGPQLVDELLPLLREAETADQGQLWDGRNAGLSYTTRRRRETGTVMLRIDAGAGELAGGFDPTDDDQRNLNKMVASRLRGVSATYEDSTGPLGTGAIGIYDDSVTVNINSDDQVIQHAAWHVRLGTQLGYRYPTITVDALATPHLVPAALAIIPGERIDVVGLDAALSGFPSGTVSLIVEGIGHRITARTWQITFRCSLFSPWGVGRVAAETGDTSDLAMRVDTDGATLAANAPAGATSISVASSAQIWTVAADDYPLLLAVGGIPVRATACAGASSPQTFTVDPLPVRRTAGAPVELWDPRPIGLG